jgi:hypothetical protein
MVFAWATKITKRKATKPRREEAHEGFLDLITNFVFFVSFVAVFFVCFVVVVGTPLRRSGRQRYPPQGGYNRAPEGSR